MQYYGTRLSENISKREPEGYLLCLNVPVARTGSQNYLPEELGLSPEEGLWTQTTLCPDTEGGLEAQATVRPALDPDRKALHYISVQRPPEEVFAPEAIASFEGMPVTNDHPPDGVSIDNIRMLQKGHAHNVRRGTGEESDLLLADLIITDPVLIDAILSGKREISCGYTYELCEENGQYIQRKIRGNHVAVVDAGRAGNRVSIKDEHPSGSPIRKADIISHHQPERSHPIMKKSLFKKLTQMARDGDPEAIEALAEAVEGILESEIIETPAADPVAPEVAVVAAAVAPDPAPAVTDPASAEVEAEAATDNDTLTAILERLDQLIALLSASAPAADDDPETPAETAGDLPEELAEVVEEALEAVGETSGEPALEEAAGEIAAAVEEALAESIAEAPEAPSTVLDPDNADRPESAFIGDAVRNALAVVNPLLQKLHARDRRKVCATIAKRISSRCGNDSARYAALLQARRPARDEADLGRRIMQKRNPNYRD